jgi:hypothetical protein
LIFSQAQDFCRRTKCPECDAPVFFIRHNGGCLWVDELGWPWDKHPCMDNAPEASATWQKLLASASERKTDRGAVVLAVVFDPRGWECAAVIAEPGGQRRVWMVEDVADPRKLLGALVIVSPETKKLVCPELGEFSIREALRPCVKCNQQLPYSQMDEHVKTAHRIQRCPICSSFVTPEAYNIHLLECEAVAKRSIAIQEYLDELKIQYVTANGALLPFTDVLKNIGSNYARLTREQQKHLAMLMGGVHGNQRMLALFRKIEEGLRRQRNVG